jgi:class 3 adenylate cyclase
MAADKRSTVAALEAALAVFSAEIELHGGCVIDMAGDSVLAVFQTGAGRSDPRPRYTIPCPRMGRKSDNRAMV